VIRTIDGRPFFAVEQNGLVDQSYYRLVPGVAFDHGRGIWRIPANLVPTANGHAPKHRRAPSGLTLHPHQAQAVEAIKHGDTLVAFDVGLGKTATAVQAYTEAESDRPLIVCGPLRVSTVWCGERSDAAKHYNMVIAGVEGVTPAKWEPPGRVHGIFVHYEVLPAWVDYINKLRPSFIVCDEAHELRNPKTRAWKAARAISRHPWVRRRVALTATPVVNGVIDLWAILDLLQPHAWGPSYVDFGVRYNDFHQTEFGWTRGNETNTDELQQRLHSVVLRKSRAELAKTLPGLERVLVRVPQSQLDTDAGGAYREAQKRLSHVFLEDGVQPGEHLAALTGMLQTLSRAKRQAALNEALVLCTAHHKVFIACWYKETAAWLCQQLKKAGVMTFGPIDSSMAKAKREHLLRALVDAQRPYIDDGCAVVGTMGTTGLGRNELACCSGALVVDLWWVPMVLLQLEGRLQRPGQDAPFVDWRYLVAEKTADEVMFRYLEKKARAVAASLQDSSALSLCEFLGGRDEDADIKQFAAELAALPEEG